MPRSTDLPLTHAARSARAAGSNAARHIEVRTATTWRRGFASLTDAVPLLAIAALTAGALLWSGDAELPPSRWNLLDRGVDLFNAQPELLWVPLAALAAGIFLYHFLFTAALGFTPGKRIFGLDTIDGDGLPPSMGRLLFHCLLRVLGVALLFAGVIWAIVDPERRTAHDRLAGIYVVEKRAGR